MDIRYAPQMSFLPCAQILHNNGNLTVLNRKTHEKHKNKKRSYFIRTAGFALSRWNRGYIYSPRCKPWVGWPHRSEPSKTAAYITVFDGSFPFFGYYPHLAMWATTISPSSTVAHNAIAFVRFTDFSTFQIRPYFVRASA